MLGYRYWAIGNNFQWNVDQNTIIPNQDAASGKLRSFVCDLMYSIAIYNSIDSHIVLTKMLLMVVMAVVKVVVVGEGKYVLK